MIQKQIQSDSIYHVINLSGGKDSTALTILMVERGLPTDAVFWANTCCEFPETAGHITQVDEYFFRKRGLHITELKAAESFEWMLLEHPLKNPDAIKQRTACGQPLKGYGWPRMQARWYTRYLKTDLLNREA